MFVIHFNCHINVVKFKLNFPLMPFLRVQNLSLRHCGMTDKGAKSIGEALGTVKRTNTKLVTLNLAGNQISDQGAIDIANVCQ